MSWHISCNRNHEMSRTYRWEDSRQRRKPLPKYETGERCFYFPTHGQVQERLDRIFEKDDCLKPYQRLMRRDGM